MRFRIKTAVALTFVVLLSGCASHYVIATKDGQMLLTRGKPALDPATGLLSYTDEEGVKRQINNNNISQVIER
ncbi:putative lipoprotein YgdR [Dickeya dianthicola]|uniref:YgdI/YgdR family lipoprotein n=1 Tax=Dickeya dianthicola TaxID=204039 RepID=A0ABX9NRH2_9GAMM|nr:YgdI/YgdR family lipoprotein [Dickeya dianthicola]ATO31906.1 putative lipoprotein ygdR precursor [Dickeya dianthicola RNS04.9]AYC17926.1 putative lipoprotein YgdR [Dickeya dianthicola]MBI0439392.1 YgdI/YgdR family lipoprotein [Dickeya dianthicola]MBI0449674.1 YgdI/YgdR family lipoprotein [Dickeya dianthicola]MBI0454254.1 YgdI/YgdR family lipoprotein [Dickeya dianthicola]